jgi:hypothetical protein
MPVGMSAPHLTAPVANPLLVKVRHRGLSEPSPLLPPIPDIGEPDCHVSVVPIVLQKSFCTGDRRRDFRVRT